jgi:hypothetical protein
MVARNWGLNPKRMLWVYQQVILPRITYGCIVWWHKAQIESNKNKLESLQRTALLLTTEAMKTTPAISLEALLNVFPLNINIKMLAYAAYLRLKKAKTWTPDVAISPHKKISSLLTNVTTQIDSCSRQKIQYHYQRKKQLEL